MSNSEKQKRYYNKNKESINLQRKYLRDTRTEKELQKVKEILSLPPKDRKYFLDWSFVFEGSDHLKKRIQKINNDFDQKLKEIEEERITSRMRRFSHQAQLLKLRRISI